MAKGFKLVKSKLGSFEELTFQNHKGVKLSILPGFGARLNSLHLKAGREVIDLIAGIDDPAEMVIDKLYKSAILFPFPNRLDEGRYTFEGRSYQFPINEPEYNTALHGFLAKEPFVIKKINCDRKKAVVTLVYDYMGQEEYYPFPFTLIVKYKITSKANFKIQFEIKNNGARNMPYGLGWHPYFKTTGWAKKLKLKLPNLRQVEVNERLLPTGSVYDFNQYVNGELLPEKKLDNCFELVNSQWKVEVKDSDNHQAAFEISAEESFNYMQIYQPPQNSLIALEPVTCNINAFNNSMGLSVLEPGGTFKSEITIAPVDPLST